LLYNILRIDGCVMNFGKRIIVYNGTDENDTIYLTIYANMSKFNLSAGR